MKRQLSSSITNRITQQTEIQKIRLQNAENYLNKNKEKIDQSDKNESIKKIIPNIPQKPMQSSQPIKIDKHKQNDKTAELIQNLQQQIEQLESELKNSKKNLQNNSVDYRKIKDKLEIIQRENKSLRDETNDQQKLIQNFINQTKDKNILHDFFKNSAIIKLQRQVKYQEKLIKNSKILFQEFENSIDIILHKFQNDEQISPIFAKLQNKFQEISKQMNYDLSKSISCEFQLKYQTKKKYSNSFLSLQSILSKLFQNLTNTFDHKILDAVQESMDLSLQLGLDIHIEDQNKITFDQSIMKLIDHNAKFKKQFQQNQLNIQEQSQVQSLIESETQTIIGNQIKSFINQKLSQHLMQKFSTTFFQENFLLTKKINLLKIQIFDQERQLSNQNDFINKKLLKLISFIKINICEPFMNIFMIYENSHDRHSETYQMNIASLFNLHCNQIMTNLNHLIENLIQDENHLSIRSFIEQFKIFQQNNIPE